ncbi:hypothetical protein LINGRAHAP2_LOCUS24350 [Linum grandiflorum]
MNRNLNHQRMRFADVCSPVLNIRR